MAENNLATYLNDHRSGAEAALTLLEHLEQSIAGTPEAKFSAKLRAEIDADRGELESLMSRLKISVSRPRLVAAWLSERFVDLKLRVDDSATGPLRRLEVFEAVSIGIEGKRLLWLSLAAAAESRPDLRGPDYQKLVRRAEEQRRDVEAVRREAARAALGIATPAP